jgi:signal peptidase
MTGTIPKGSIVYAQVVHVDQLRAGDIITFVPPGESVPVTHRIAGITRGTDGQLVFQTKGDFNQAADPWHTTFLQPTAARYAFHVPLLGYGLAAFSIREVRMLLIALPALLISISILWSIWRSAAKAVRSHGEESVRRHEGDELSRAVARLRLADEEAGA